MADVNTTVGAATAVAGWTGGSSMSAPDTEAGLEREDEDDGEGEVEDEDEDEEDDEEEEDSEEEKIENEEENVDNSDDGHWEDLPSSQYSDEEGDFDEEDFRERAERNQSGLFFRASGPNTGVKAGEKHPNIDYSILNTEHSVIPHRFARRHVEPGKNRGYSGLLRMPRRRLIRMLRHHTRGLVDGRSEISSWTHSLIAAISFAQHIFERDGKATIHIIDTAQITNDIIHNADIRRSFGNKKSVTTLFPTEWIVHGVVDRPGYWLVGFNKIKPLLPWLRLKPTCPNSWPYMGHAERQAINNAITSRQVQQDLPRLQFTIKELAILMMNSYKAPGTPRAKMIQLRLHGMLYCLYPRFTRKMLKAGLKEKDHHDMIKAMGDLTAASALQKCFDIMNDDVFTHEDFPDVTQTRLFLRLLATSGEAARQVEEANRKSLKRKREEDEGEEGGEEVQGKSRSSETKSTGCLPGLAYLTSLEGYD